MELDERQMEVVKKMARELTAEVMTLPLERAAGRLEAISIVLDQLHLTEAAECARHAACRFGEGEIAMRELLQTVESLA